jgi:hypothetical protein
MGGKVMSDAKGWDSRVLASEPVEFQTFLVPELVTDEYQRPINTRWLDAMTEDYDPLRWTIPVVSVRAEKNYVIDGQHRIEMLRALGVQVVTCQVHRGLTVEQEADLFYHLNHDTVRPGISAEFKALLIARDPVAISIVRAVESAGGQINLQGNRGPRMVAAVGALRTLHNWGGSAMIRDVLILSFECWPANTFNNEARDAKFLLGLGMFMYSYASDPGYNREAFIERMKTFAPGEIRQAAGTIRAETGGPLTVTFYAQALRDVYNARRRTKRLTFPVRSPFRGKRLPTKPRRHALKAG